MKINSVELVISAVRRSQYPLDKLPEFLLIGRSNVGKSSFINTLVNRKNYARTSGTPGKTQTLNFYFVNEEFYLVDVPGYGYAKVDASTEKKFGMMIEEYLGTRETLKHVFMLVDARHKPSGDDILMLDFLNYYNIKVTVIATKIDKLGKSKIQKQIKLIAETLKVNENEIISFSSVTKEGKPEVQDLIDNLMAK